MSRHLILLLFLLYSLPAAAQLKADFGVDKSGGCAPLAVQFTNQTSGASASAVYRWDFGNGNLAVASNPQAIFTSISTYNVTLTVQDGTQTAVASHTVVVYAPPVFGFSLSTNKVCAPAPVVFTAGAAGSSYLWDFGDGVAQVGGATIAHAYTTAGTVSPSLTLTDEHGCVATRSLPDAVTVLPDLVADFGTDKRVLCVATDPVQFTNNSVGSGTLSYQWSFGDGGVSTQANPSYSYAARGTYTVILKATSSEGCSAADTQTNVLNVANYQTDFVLPAAVCVGASVSFSDASTPLSAIDGSGRVWTIDGVVEGAGPVQSWVFGTAGPHTVALTDVYGACSQTVTKTYTVSALPVVAPFDENIQGQCGVPVAVQFTDHTPGAVQWGWVFQYHGYDPFPVIVNGGPGNTSTYVTAGTYDVQLTVTNAAGCSAALVQPVTVSSPPVVNIFLAAGNQQTCGTSATVTFGITHPELLQSYSWDLGDGSVSANVSPTQTYTGAGTYNVVLHYTTLSGCTGVSNTLPIVVSKPFTADFHAEATTVCTGAAVAFGSSVLADEGAISTSWNFGDGSADAFTPVSAYHTYTEPGVYTVTLSIATAGCQQTVTKTNYITVVTSPSVSVSHTNTCAGSRGDVSFSVDATAATGLAWDFGDGVQLNTGAAVTQLVHTYTSTGIYSVTVTASNGQCSASANDVAYVLVKQQPLLRAPAATVCPDGVLALSLTEDVNPLSVYGNIGYQYQWQYGDGVNFLGSVAGGTGGGGAGSSGASAVAFSLSNFQAGESGLRVITTSFYFGCSDTSNIIPMVVRGAVAGYEIVEDGRCFTMPVVLEDTSKVDGGNKIISWLWDFGDGHTSTSGGTVSHVYASPGSYPVKLTVQDADGCSASSQPAVAMVEVDGPLAAFYSPGGDSVPLGSTLTFVNSSNTTGNTNVLWNWDFGDGSSSSTDFSPSHQYAAVGTYTVVLTARDATGGCVSSATLVVTVIPFNSAFQEKLSYIAGGSCPPVLVQFTNTSANYASLSWDFGDGVVETGVVSPSHVYVDPGKYIVTLTIVGVDGRTWQTSDSVIVVVPSTVLSGGGAVCQGQAAGFKASGSRLVSGYIWDYGDGVVGSSGVDSVGSHVYTVAGQFNATVVVTDAQGCSVAAVPSVAVDVRPLPVVVVAPAVAAVCPGKVVDLSASGGGSYAWSPAAGLSDTASPSPVASPTESTIYTVTVTDANGCADTASVAVKAVANCVEIECSASTVAIPDAFTPNGDGHNDRWNILGVAEVNHLVIYDRWGQRVYERGHFLTGDAGAGWDGTMGGQAAPAGVYAYFVELQCPTGGVVVRKGTVVLVR